MTFAPEASSTQRVLVTRGLEAPQAWIRDLAESLWPVTVDVDPVQPPGRTIERLNRLQPRVVVVDEPSLGEVGWVLLRQIRRVNASVPCLMVVHRAEPMLLDKALQMSAYSVFEAPVDVELMRQMVCRLLRRANYRAQ